MLIETPIKDGDVITIKTSAGDEVVAVLEKETDSHLTVKKPMAIMASGQGLGLGPFVFTVNPDTRINISKSAIVFFAKTDGEMAKQYISSSTGITV